MTDEERREAARRLRDFKQLRAAFKDSSICAFSDVLGVGYMDWEHICARLADLIEPEPERTCHIAMVSLGEWECDACGGGIDWDTYDEGDPPNCNYCPNCGAKVVGE